MKARKVMKVRNSYFINIPMDVVRGLKIDKGDVLWVGYLSGYGVVMTKEKNAGEVSTSIDVKDQMKALGDEAMERLRKYAKALESSFTTNILVRLVGPLMEGGRLDFKGLIDALSRKTNALEKEIHMVSGLVKDKKSC